MTDREVVIDASVVAKIFFKEEVGEDADRLLDLPLRFHAPHLLDYEFTNIVRTWLQRRLISTSDADRIRRGFTQLKIELHHSNGLIDAAYEIALNTGLAVYDSSYVAVAYQFALPVLTADRRLINALATSRYSVTTRTIADLVG